MSNHSRRTVFLAVPGTQDTRELDLETVRSAVARGEIALDNWAWSPERKEWVPLAQLPEFAAAPAAASAPAIPVVRAETAAIPQPVVRTTPIAVLAGAAAPTPVKIPLAAGPKLENPMQGGQHAATTFSKPIEEHHEFPVFKVLFVLLGVIIAALVGVNYCLVDQPFHEKMENTPFSGVQAYAHLGAFVQPSVLLIHVVPSSQITSDNFADFLAALTKSAPRQAIPGKPFATISLTTAWFGQYAITADSWDGFAEMRDFTPVQKREYVLSHLERINGDPLVMMPKTATDEQIKLREDVVWNNLILQFQTGSTGQLTQ